MSSGLVTQRGLQSLHAKIKRRRQQRGPQAIAKTAAPIDKSSGASGTIGEAIQSAYAVVAGNALSLLQRLEDYRAELSSGTKPRV